MGCLVPTENDECLVWRMRLERNGTTIWQFITSAGDFPRIGTRLQSDERKTRGGRIFDCEAGDVFRLVIEDIIAGSVYSGVRPDIGIYDDDANKFDLWYSTTDLFRRYCCHYEQRCSGKVS